MKAKALVPASLFLAIALFLIASGALLTPSPAPSASAKTYEVLVNGNSARLPWSGVLEKARTGTTVILVLGDNAIRVAPTLVAVGGREVEMTWAQIISLAQVEGGVRFVTQYGTVVARLTKYSSSGGLPPDKCSWYWEVTIPGVGNPVGVCFSDLMEFLEKLRNGEVAPPGGA